MNYPKGWLDQGAVLPGTVSEPSSFLRKQESSAFTSDVEMEVNFILGWLS